MSNFLSRLGLSGFVTLSLVLSGAAVRDINHADKNVPMTSFAQALPQNPDQAQILQLTKAWFETWSPGEGSIDWEQMGQFFTQSPNQLLIFDDAGGSVVVLNSWAEYRSTWEPFMENFTQWQIVPEGDIRVLVDGDLATTAFTLAGGGIDREGKSVVFRQRGTHVWQRIDGRWAIVHEHLTTDS